MARSRTAVTARPRAGRRAFLKTLPSAVAAGLAAPHLAEGAQAPATTIDSATVKCGERIADVQFTDAEEALVAGNVETNRRHIETLRDVPVAPDVEPAFSFRPARRDAPIAPPLPSRARPIPLPPGPAGRPASDEALAFLPATALASLLRTRRISSAELTRLYLDRLKRHGPTLECVVTLTEDLALQQAADADREIAAGRYRGPLHGMPWGVKDLFATRGIRTTWGAKPYEHQVIDRDATAVARLHAAGAVLLAKLTTGELAVGDLWFGGRTRNPWNVERGSGGSSAGPASATAAGLVAFAVGTETGGSIIQPASNCGVVGLRPTYGRISRYGAMTLRWTQDKVGPIGRTVTDCAIVFDALRGPDGHDETVADMPFVFDAGSGLAGMRVAFLEREFLQPPDDANEEEQRQWPARQRVLQSALDEFRKAGVRLEPAALPDLPARSVYALLNAEAGAAFDDLVRAGGHNELAGKGRNDRANQLRACRFIPAVDYIRAQRVRTLLAQQMNAILARYEVLISPSDSASVTVTNLTGHPALTMNAGFADSMPCGLMFTGRLYDEATVLRVALAYERATEWHTKHPALK